MTLLLLASQPQLLLVEQLTISVNRAIDRQCYMAICLNCACLLMVLFKILNCVANYVSRLQLLGFEGFFARAHVEFALLSVGSQLHLLLVD